MKQKNVIVLNIGDKLYNYQSLKGVFTYNIIGIRNYTDSIIYEVECQECVDHEKCKLLVVQKDNEKRFKYVSMINEDENCEQYYWHNNTDYFITQNDCKKNAYNEYLNKKEKEIEKLELQLENSKKGLIEIQLLLKEIQ